MEKDDPTLLVAASPQIKRGEKKCFVKSVNFTYEDKEKLHIIPQYLGIMTEIIVLHISEILT